MVKYQNCSTDKKLVSTTTGEKQPRYRIGNKQFRAFAIAAFSALAVAVSSVGVHHLHDIQRRCINLETNLYEESVELHNRYNDALQNNEELLVMVDNRNDNMAESLVEIEELTTVMVSAGLPDSSFTGYSQNVSSISAIDDYVMETSQNEIVEGVENLLTKYSAYTTFGGKKTDFTAELFYLLEVECAKYDLDPYVMIGIIMTESRGNSKAKNPGSTATGMCQLLRGTAKSVYEGALGHPKGSYNHDMAYDPALNIRMGVAYLGGLKQQYGLYRAIQKYRGKTDISGYVNSINNYMRMSGRSIQF